MEAVKGFRDYAGEEAIKRSLVRRIIEDTFRLYSFFPAETPIIEKRKFVEGENPDDEAVSTIFKLKDRAERDLALRYEFTFQLKRIAKNKKLPFRRYQIGEVFRDEPTGKNRWKQFVQCDADIVGATLNDEAEILSLVSKILNKLKINFKIYLNNRELLNEILEELKITKKEEVLREIDKLNKIPEKEVNENLKKYRAEKILKILKKPKNFFKKYSSFKKIEDLEKLSKLYNVKFTFLPFLVRGLSYYTSTIFEVKSSLKEMIAGGGTYLTNGIPSVGISFGLDRISLLAKVKDKLKKFIVISLNKDEKALQLCSKIRNLNASCLVFFGKPSKALEYADSYQFDYAIFVGEDEIRKRKIKIRDLKTGKESLIDEKFLEKFINEIQE